jgi:shikimate kinase
MGVGKTTVANFLEANKGMKILEMDHLIEEREGLSIQEIFSVKGEPYFRKLETKILKELNKERTINTVISCGGGIVIDPDNLPLIQSLGVVIHLNATSKVIYQRIKNCKKRPLLKGNIDIDYISDLLERRQIIYEKISNKKIDTTEKTVEEVCKELLTVICDNS